MKKYTAEFLGTFWLVLGGCGSAVLAAAFPDVGIGLLGVSLAFGLTVTAQLATWTLASLAMVGLWFRVFKQSFVKTRVGTADGEVIGEIGLLVSAVAPFERGKVRFQRPVLGSEEWVCLADAAIAAGERVKVVAVEGSFLKVSKT